MKQRKPLRRTPLAPGKPLQRKTELRSSGPIKPRRSAGDASTDGPTPPTPRRGPTKQRIESSEIPGPIRTAVLERDNRCCQRCGVSLIGKRYSLQHRDPRGAGGSRLLHTMANLVALCGTGTTECHGHVESYRDEATALGWLVPNGVTPEEWPVLRATPDGPRWQQPGDGWTDAVPHPRQIEMGALVGAEEGQP